MTTTREDDMSQRLPNGLAWTLLGLTVVLLTAAAVLGRDAVDLDTVRAELLGVVDSAVQPAHLSVWTARAGTRGRALR